MLSYYKAFRFLLGFYLLGLYNYYRGGSSLRRRLEARIGITDPFPYVKRNYSRISYYRFLFGFVDELLRLQRVICSRGTVFYTLKALSCLGLGFRPRYTCWNLSESSSSASSSGLGSRLRRTWRNLLVSYTFTSFLLSSRNSFFRVSRL